MNFAKCMNESMKIKIFLLVDLVYFLQSTVVPVGAFLVSILASPFILAMNLLHLPKLYGLIAG